MTAVLNPEPARRRNNWLIASVALNLFLLGGIAGALLLGPPHMRFPGAGGGPEDFGPGRLLSPAGRELLFRLHRQERDQMRPQLDALRSAREAIEAAFAADPFDRAALAAAQVQMQAAEQGLSQAMGEQVAKLAESLSAEDRKAFATAMRHLPKGPPGMAGGEFRPHGPMPPERSDRPGPSSDRPEPPLP